MHPRNEAFQAASRKGSACFPSQLSDSNARRAAHPAEPAVIVLDAYGTVCGCTPAAAELFGADMDAALGRHVTALVPSLPFRPSTPGYNVAYASFSPDEERAWQRLGAVDMRGRAFLLQGCLDALQWQGTHMIFVSLRPHERSGAAAESGKDANLDGHENASFMPEPALGGGWLP
jgi:hypothetical protein